MKAGLRASPLLWAALAYGLPLIGLILAAGSAHAQTPCPATTISFAVTAEHDAPVIKSSYTSEELRILAGRAADHNPHPPLGLYVGMFGYDVEVPPQGCAVTVTVRMFLAPRLVEVASDGPCRPDVVTEHYLLHAREDDFLLSRYAAQARGLLDQIEQTGPSGRGRDAVVRLVVTAVNRLLQPYNEERERALRAADTDDALARLAQGCGYAR